MRTVAALIAGLLLSLTTFVGGLVVALTFLNVGEPDHRPSSQDTAALWTDEPVQVDKTKQSFERLPARPAPKEQKLSTLNKAAAGARRSNSEALQSDVAAEEPMVDPMTTGAVETPKPGMDASRPTWRTAAHAEWCARRYRSYDAEDNTYRPYGGGRRACQSPYSTVAAADVPAGTRAGGGSDTALLQEQAVTADAPPKIDQASLQDVAEVNTDSEEHIRSCFARYRSYRPEDNSYQPFDGGPRRQCR